MAMPMRMRLVRRIARTVGVLVVGVMRMQVIVIEFLVPMQMLVTLSEMQPYSDTHKRRGEAETKAHRISEKCDRCGRAHKRSS